MKEVFNQERFDKWEEETHIPKEVMDFLDAICKKIGISTPEEETIVLRNRGGHVYGYMKGFSISYCTSSYEDGPSVDYSDTLVKFLKGLDFRIENSYGDNGMDYSTSWHDTYWTYEFGYKPSEVYDEMFYDYEGED